MIDFPALWLGPALVVVGLFSGGRIGSSVHDSMLISMFAMRLISYDINIHGHFNTSTLAT